MAHRREPLLTRMRKDMRRHYIVYLMAIPVVAYFFIFCYMPMYGTVIAFKDFRPGLGIWESKWVGLKHFRSFFMGANAFRLIRNTFLLSFYSLIFGFPVPIIFSLLINEIGSNKYKRTVQTITYMPHFISMVVICGMITDMTMTTGIINTVIAFFGGTPSNLLARPEMFRSVYVVSGIWQELGWSTIIYLSALSQVDVEQYEAALLDGANKLEQMWHITLPGIMPTIVILLILNVGSLLSVGWEKVLLLQNPATYETSDVISTFVYRRGIQDGDYSYSTAVGLFNSVVNFALLFIANKVSQKVGETSLW